MSKKRRQMANCSKAMRLNSTTSKRPAWPVVDRLERRLCLSATFSSPAFVAGTGVATGIAAGDFNRDGKPDITVASSGSESLVAVYLNQNGTFGTPTLIPIGGALGGITAGDFLGNGHQDIAVIVSSINGLDVFLNDGAGNFSQGPQTSLGGNGDTAIAAGDFNGDQRDDVAIADPVNNAVVVELSAGSGAFALGQSLSVPSPGAVIVGDFNGDQRPDLACLSNTGSIYVALNDGSGSFATPVAYGLGATVTTPAAIADGVFTGSGRSDLVGVGAGTTGGAAGILISQPDGTFASAADTTLAAAPDLVVTGDFTGSGFTDLSIISPSGGLDILPGNNDGTFGAAEPIFTTDLGAPATQAVVGNFANGIGIAFLSSSQGGFGVTTDTSSAVARPDLSASLAGSGPATTVAGLAAKFKEKLAVTAGSGAVKGKASAAVLLSPDESAADSVLTLATGGGQVKLKAGATKTLGLKFAKSIPATVAAGTYHLLIQLTDTAGVVSTVDSGQTLSVVVPAVDLTGSFFKIPASVKAGKKLNATLVITNTLAANVPADGMLTVDIDTSADGLLSDAVLLLPKSKHIKLKPGKSIKLMVKLTISASTFLVVNLDPGNVVFPDDIDKTNNTFVTAGAIAVD